MRTVCIIPARRNSARIPGKNWRMFHGKPMIVRAVELANESGLFDDVIVSTDGNVISNLAAASGARIFSRTLDDGARGTQDVTREVLEDVSVQCGIACVLYPCTPLLEWHDLVRGYQLLQHNGTIYTMSVHQDTREDCGGFYFGWAQAFRDGFPLDTPQTARVPIESERAIDINTEADWSRAEYLYGVMTGVYGVADA